jgi:hypothetical protein
LGNIPSREWSHIEQEDLLCLLRGVTREDGRLHSGAIGNGLVGVDRLIGLLAVEEIGDELDDFRDTSGTTDEDDLVYVGLVDLRIAEDLLDWVESGAE